MPSSKNLIDRCPTKSDSHFFGGGIHFGASWVWDPTGWPIAPIQPVILGYELQIFSIWGIFKILFDLNFGLIQHMLLKWTFCAQFLRETKLCMRIVFFAKQGWFLRFTVKYCQRGTFFWEYKENLLFQSSTSCNQKLRRSPLKIILKYAAQFLDIL